MNAADTMVPPIAAGRRRQGSEIMRSDTAALRYNRVQLALGIVAIAAATVLILLGVLNRSLQADVAAGQARITNAQAAANVNNTLIRLLAKAAAEKNDDKIRALLSQNGISFREATPGASDPAAGGVTASPAAIK